MTFDGSRREIRFLPTMDGKGIVVEVSKRYPDGRHRLLVSVRVGARALDQDALRAIRRSMLKRRR